MEGLGQKRTEEHLLQILIRARLDAFTTKSDFARDNADYVAMAASQGLISTRVMNDVFSRHWQITAKGNQVLEEAYGIEDETEA